VQAAEAFWLVSPQELDRTLQESLFSLLSRGLMAQAAPSDTDEPSLYQRFKNRLAKVLS
jgi:hypothetical protein